MNSNYDFIGELIIRDDTHALVKGTFSNKAEVMNAASFSASIDMGDQTIEKDIKKNFTTVVLDREDDGQAFMIIEKLPRGGLLANVIASQSFDLFYNPHVDLKQNIDRALFLWVEAKSLAAQKAHRTYEVDETRPIILRGVSALRTKFELYKSTYPPETQSIIEELLQSAGPGSSVSTNKEKALQRLRYILGIRSYARPIEKTKAEIIAAVQKHVYGLDNIVNELADIALSPPGQKRPSVLLIGPPKSAKSLIIKSFAEAIEKPLYTLQAAGLNSKVALVADSAIFDGSDGGVIVKTLNRYGTSDIVMSIDNVDKTSQNRSRDGNPMDVFFDLLSKKTIYDNFLEAEIDMSSTLVIATASCEDDIGHIKEMFDRIVRIPRLAEDDCVEVIKRHIIPELQNVAMREDAIRYLLSNYCTNIADASKYLKKIALRATGGEVLEITTSVIDEEIDPIVDEERNPVLFYHRRRAHYTDDAKEFIESLIDKLENADDAKKEIIQKQLFYATHLVARSERTPFNPDDFLTNLNKSHFGLEQVKQEIASNLYAKNLSDDDISSTRLLFVGPPGVGKSSLIEAVAKSLNLGYARIALNGVIDPRELKGHSPIHSNSDAGLIVSQVSKVGTDTDVIIHLDEIDKCGEAVMNTLIDLLDDSATFQDAFLPGLNIDFGRALFFATANEQVNPIIRDRFRIIYLQGYTPREKRGILKGCLIPKHTGAFKSRSIIFDEETIDMLVKEYCTSSGVRDLNKATEALVRSKLFETRESKDTELVVNTADVIKVLGHAPKNCVELDCDFRPGFVKALAVDGQGIGLVLGIETVCLHDRDDVIITGMVKDSARETIELAKTYIETHYPGKLKGGFHIHFGTGISTIEKHGASAGVAIVCSIFSAMTGINIDPEIAMTGEISLNRVWGVGGVKEKLWAAYKAGCKKMLLPRVNYEALKTDELPDIEIIPVATIDEVVEICFSNKEIKLTA